MGELAHADAAQAELAEHGPRPATALAARVAPHLELRLALGLGDQRLLGHVVFVTSSAPLVRDHRALREPSVDLPSRPEGKAQCGEQRPALLVGLRRGHHGDVHAPDLDDAVVVDLGEDELLGQPEGEIAVPVEAPGRQPAEVADARQRHRHQPVQELPHPVPPQGDLGADRLALADLEAGDRLLGLCDLRLLPGDRGQVTHGAVELARLPDGVAHAHVDHDLDRPRHLHDVREPQLLLQPLPQLGPVVHLEPGSRDLWCGCRLCHVRSQSSSFPALVFARYSFAPHLAHTRSLLPSSTRWATRVGLPQLEHTIWTLEASSHASFSVMPPVWPPRWVGRIFSCRFTRVTPSTSTLLRPGSTRSTRPVAVMSLPAITITRSSLCILIALLPLSPFGVQIHYSTSGARLMIFMKRLSRSSRPTGPKMRVPRGFCCSLMMTAAFSSKRM